MSVFVVQARYTDSSIPGKFASMKNILLSIVFFLSACFSYGIHAEASSDQWRLVKKTWALPGDALERYEYQYDTAGRIIEMRNYRGKKLNLSEKDFVYDDHGRISSYQIVFGDSDPYRHVMTYDQQGRLKSHEEIRHRRESGKDQVTLTRTFSYGANTITENKTRASFGGKLADETTYFLDAKGNFIRKTGIDQNSGQKSQEYIFGNYDDKPNPLIFTGAYFLTELNSRHAGGEGFWEGSPTATSSFTHNKDSLVSKMVITYTTSDGGKVNHTYEYTYVKIK